LDAISKISTLKPKKGKFYDHHPSDLWPLNLTGEEVKGLNSGLNIGVKTIRSLNVAFLDSHLGDEDAIPDAFKAITRLAEPRDLIRSDTLFLSIMLDLPLFTEYVKCRFRACITLPEGASAPKELGFMVIPEGRYAYYSMKGTSQAIFKSLMAFKHRWLDQSGYEIAEVTGFEVYSENPASRPYESIQRQILIPVKPA